MTATVTGPPIDAVVVENLEPGGELPELELEDCAAVVKAYPGVVVAGPGATVWAHPGVVVDPQDGSVVHLAAGAQLLEDRPGALEQGLISVLAWDPGQS